MAKQSKIGVCENCGDKGALTGSFGRQVCSTCLKIRSNVNSHLPKIANAARSLGKGEDLIKALIPDGGSLAVQVTATLLQDISALVGYEGEDPAELVEAVRRRALACASCEAEDVLAEIREIVGYTPEQGDKGLAAAVRGLAAAGGKDCTNDEILLRVDLDRSTRVIEELRAKLQEGLDANAELRAELTVAQQSLDEWEQRCAAAEEPMQDMEAELCNREDAPAAPCASTTYLLDIALRALRGEGPDADQLAGLIEAARRAA